MLYLIAPYLIGRYAAKSYLAAVGFGTLASYAIIAIVTYVRVSGIESVGGSVPKAALIDAMIGPALLNTLLGPVLAAVGQYMRRRRQAQVAAEDAA